LAGGNHLCQIEFAPRSNPEPNEKRTPLCESGGSKVGLY
jgi:hypothetical protein